MRLGGPTIVVLVVQTLVMVAEAYFVSFLGTDALAGTALVFPVLMLMLMMSNGGIGGGVASAVARAIGSGRMADANALVLHTLVLGVLFGLAFTIPMLVGGFWVYGFLGGSGKSLDAALQYSAFVFGSAVLTWVANLLSAALRGAGEVRIPALIIFGSAPVILPLSPLLIFGLGPVSGFGIAGAGMAMALYFGLATAALIVYMRSARSPLRLGQHRLEWRLFKDILGVGIMSAVGSAQMNITVAVITSLVGVFGTGALAGYGIASRLDYLLIPLLFGLGTAVVTMVGTNVGAGNVTRARKIAWTGALLAAGVTELIGLVVALAPQMWMGIFSSDPEVLASGATYLRVVGPSFGFIGLGLLLYFAAQGAGRIVWPVLGGTARMLLAVVGGWIATVSFDIGLTGLFGIVAVSAVIYGSLVVLAVYLQPWDARSAGRAPADASSRGSDRDTSQEARKVA
jgi:putative MATE family efflux protein